MSKYVVISANETSFNEIFEYETETEAFAKVNEFMIATNNSNMTTVWEEGHEREFLALCAEHPHTCGAVAMYDSLELFFKWKYCTSSEILN